MVLTTDERGATKRKRRPRPSDIVLPLRKSAEAGGDARGAAGGGSDGERRKKALLPEMRKTRLTRRNHGREIQVSEWFKLTTLELESRPDAADGGARS